MNRSSTGTGAPRMMTGALLIGLAIFVLAVPSAIGGERRPPSLAAKCGDASGVVAHPFWLTTDDRVRLYSIEVGEGPVAVVLAHESPADLCGWLPYIPTLTAAGLRVLAFDFRGFGNSAFPAAAAADRAYLRDLRAALSRVRRDGATRVFLTGDSYGGAVALTYAPQLRLNGVLSLSGEATLPRGTPNALGSVSHLRAPLLIVGSRHDHYVPVPDALALLRRAGSKDKRTAFYPGGFHGWDIIEDAPYAAKARALILAWIRARDG